MNARECVYNCYKIFIPVIPFVVAAGVATESAAQSASPIDEVTTVTDEMLLNPPDGDWLM